MLQSRDRQAKRDLWLLPFSALNLLSAAKNMLLPRVFPLLLCFGVASRFRPNHESGGIAPTDFTDANIKEKGVLQAVASFMGKTPLPGRPLMQPDELANKTVTEMFKAYFQGGKAFGALKTQQEERLDSLNKEFLDDPKYSTDEDLAEKLEIFKKKYMDFDLNAQGDIDIMALKRMLEKLGAAKTHLELKKMITEVTGGMSETISYRDFGRMMLGKRSAILKIILMYEEKAKEKEEKPAGPPQKKKITDLP